MFAVLGRHSTSAPSGGGGHGSGGSLTPRRIAPLIRRRRRAAAEHARQTAATGRLELRRRQDRTAPLHPRRVAPPRLPPLPAHALERLESNLYPKPKPATRRRPPVGRGAGAGGYGSPAGEPPRPRLSEMRRMLSQALFDLTTFGRGAHGRPPGRSRFLSTSEYVGKAMRFPTAQPRFRENMPMQAHQGRGDSSLAIRAWFP